MRCGIAAVVLVVACWRDTAPTPAPVQPAVATTWIGAYSCTIAQGGYRYPPFPCAIREVDHKLVLAKLGGSVRFEGEVHPHGDGFRFEGEVYCPTGDCNEHVGAVFRPAGNQVLRAKLGSQGMLVELFRMNNAYAGDSYGGATYAGAPRSNEIE